jgi:2-polyprenyl-3-methyl-5-hydroxy-6-metoxy-1,4-benzoquinol methylase
VNSQERAFWNSWNATYRENGLDSVPERQADVVLRWLDGQRGLSLLDAGCGAGWLSERLTPFGSVVGTDLADDVLERARSRFPSVRFVAGDIMTVDVGHDFDVIVSLDVLSHVEDQSAFLTRLASLLRSGGRLLIATQNRPVHERFNRLPPPGVGQRRRWVDRRELTSLLNDNGFRIEEMFVITPRADHGLMRVIAKAGRTLRFSGLLEHLGFGWTIMASAVKD